MKVVGREKIDFKKPFIIMTNHQSNLDVLALATRLPLQLRWVAKRELLDNFVSRIYLRRIGSDFVERFDLQRSVEDLKQVELSLRAGRTPVFFPEGTFTRKPGLQPFRMGAFVLAAEAGIPVVPVSIRGTRSILRDGSWFPRRGIITVTIGAPIAPDGKDWTAAIRLRNKARAEILRLCGEHDLAPAAVPEEQAEV